MKSFILLKFIEKIHPITCILSNRYVNCKAIRMITLSVINVHIHNHLHPYTSLKSLCAKLEQQYFFFQTSKLGQQMQDQPSNALQHCTCYVLTSKYPIVKFAQVSLKNKRRNKYISYYTTFISHPLMMWIELQKKFYKKFL